MSDRADERIYQEEPVMEFLVDGKWVRSDRLDELPEPAVQTD